MSPDELKGRARRLVEELLTQGDLAVADELIAADCAHAAPLPIAPGPAGLKSWVAALRRVFPDLRAIVEDEIAEGDTVVQRLTLAGTQEGPFGGCPSTGNAVAWGQVEIFRAGPDGAFAAHWSSWDHLGVLRQLGADPAEEGTP